ncbi:MAG: carbohydrate binding family 9 domain-containing protein [Blastocatellia bacterium]|nr:carbohydrate binding family 9 domain-containing protein [Blastocatellia bacterium]MCS7157722.1 carbohydrate binding family 9 domain-containing protein [Blastocatellia bacterium]MCX7751987.1 carbohydrate binding family 9 domain-containing protein [Blastocatellia bacterium]MDW8167093.1 DUF5916 domain-containing protein [Acidobacteriota bacterium]MDW8257197.1 DUF5916 domain-containing protein [Acidobacteriota bacterium]
MVSRSLIFAFLLMLLLGAIIKGFAQAERPRLRLSRVSSPPRLEEYLQGVRNAGEVCVSDFRQREPGDGIPVSLETTACLSYDQHHLYVVFICKDDPAKVRARLSRREAILEDDLVGVTLDTFQDRRRAYLFLANPLGIQADGIVGEGQEDDMSFDTLWYSEGRLTEDGFIVRMAIPFRSLRFPATRTQTWGIALGRIIPRLNEQAFWPYITRRVAGFLQQLATLEGLEDISPGRNWQFIPYGAFAAARFLDSGRANAPAWRAEIEGRGGMDAKFILRDAFTLDLTVNPDFSQVESDDPQVTLNQRFEVFFPEKRPFFLENAGFFQTLENLFFSRRIVDPQFGARMTGKAGRWALGALAIDDRAPGKRVAPTDPRYGQRAAIGVLRVQREFAEQSSVGVLFTRRSFLSQSNSVLALDTLLRMGRNWTFTGQIMQSFTHRDGRRFSGPAYSLDLSYSGRHFFYSGEYVDRSPRFHTQLGFIRRVDVRQMEHFVRYRWFREGKRLQSFGPNIFTLANWDRRGRLQDWVISNGFQVQFAGPTEISFRRSESFELFRDLGFRKHETSLSAATAWLRWLTLGGSYRFGKGVNFYPAPGLAPFSATTAGGELELTLRPTSQLLVSQVYLYSRLGTHGESLPSSLADALALRRATVSIFNNHLLRTKVNYQFTRELSLRTIIDYTAVLPNPSLVRAEREKRVAVDILVTYLVNPWTALYVGYTDHWENIGLDPTSPGGLRRLGAPTRSTGRQVFVKFSYLFRF